MQVQPVDPRDTEWEVDARTYRVFFWTSATSCDEYDVTGAVDVAEVLRWAEEQRRDRTVELFVRHDRGGVPGLIRVFGSRPPA